MKGIYIDYNNKIIKYNNKELDWDNIVDFTDYVLENKIFDEVESYSRHFEFKKKINCGCVNIILKLGVLFNSDTGKIDEIDYKQEGVELIDENDKKYFEPFYDFNYQYVNKFLLDIIRVMPRKKATKYIDCLLKCMENIENQENTSYNLKINAIKKLTVKELIEIIKTVKKYYISNKLKIRKNRTVKIKNINLYDVTKIF